MQIANFIHNTLTIGGALDTTLTKCGHALRATATLVSKVIRVANETLMQGAHSLWTATQRVIQQSWQFTKSSACASARMIQRIATATLHTIQTGAQALWTLSKHTASCATHYFSKGLHYTSKALLAAQKSLVVGAHATKCFFVTYQTQIGFVSGGVALGLVIGLAASRFLTPKAAVVAV